MWEKIKECFHLNDIVVEKWENIPRCGAIPQSRDSPYSCGFRAFVP
jgi:hypothetical protein